MILSLISGTIFRKPEEKTSQAGKFYVMATIKTAHGSNGSYFIRALFFDEAHYEEILAAHDGDAIAVTGNLSVDVYDNGSGPRPSMTIMVARLLTLKREKRAKPAKQKSSSQQPQAADQFGDAIPF